MFNKRRTADGIADGMGGVGQRQVYIEQHGVQLNSEPSFEANLCCGPIEAVHGKLEAMIQLLSKRRESRQGSNCRAAKTCSSKID